MSNVLQGQRLLDKMTWNQTSGVIFKWRTRMLKIKSNYKNEYKNKKCRTYKTMPDIQRHKVGECESLHQDNTTNITKDDVFQEEILHL